MSAQLRGVREILTSRVTVLLEGKSILADSNPPDVLNGAAALAVDSLDLVLA